ncbi:MAG: integral rane sensor hybrid histidine kinase [Caulobacteraceae bacterium]|nr:integral rane sensor hybrid histidine kinase [Caulobacteraceae bacterium]
MNEVVSIRAMRNLISTAALIGALALVLGGLSLGISNERRDRADRIAEARVQADIVASSVTAALTFDDKAAAQEYVEAMRLNPQLRGVAVYDDKGALFASSTRPDAEPPPATTPQEATLGDPRLRLERPVVHNGGRIGTVLVRLTPPTFAEAALRHGGVALMVLMGLIVLVVIGSSQAALRRANLALIDRAAALAEANRELEVQIAEREKVEEALRQSQKMEAMGQLTGGIAHDFNNILMVASSGLELMERSTNPDKVDKLRAGIKQALDRGAGLTRQLLAFARRSPLQPRPVDLTVTLEGMAMILERSLREDIGVRIALPHDLWPVRADPTQLEVAILNVAVNARDAMPDGGKILISAENVALDEPKGLKGEFVRLSIADTGQGMTQDQLSRVFEPFFTTKEVGKGTGLGLSQVYGFARATGGDVRIESQPGEGATVNLYLPHSDAPAPALPKAAPAQIAAGKRRGRALLVEDDEQVAQVVTGMLDHLGFEVEHASSAVEALSRLSHAELLDLVLSDMVMPGGMGGMDLAKRIAADHPGLPVILATGYSESAAAARAEGFPLLIKPYTMDQLAAELNAAGLRPH